MQDKIIHYCWFGPKEIPEKEKKCIESWKKILPDYELMFWNESNSNLSENNFVKQAYESKNYAFVSDYIRTKVLYEYGGLYLDTDLELFSEFPKILEKNKCFLGFETRYQLGTAIMYFTPKHSIIKKFMNFYETHDFKDNKGNVNTIANVSILTDILINEGLVLNNNSFQTILDIDIYPREFFYPKKISDTEFKFTKETIAVHRCSNSWMTDRERRRGKNPLWINFIRPMLRTLKSIGVSVIGSENIQKLEIKIRNILK